MGKFRHCVYGLLGLSIVVFAVYSVVRPSSRENVASHNCRFWGIVFSEMQPSLEDTIRTHLDSLRSLGSANPDGWGIGYYLAPDTGVMLPVVVRGEPMALLDPRYDRAVANMIRHANECGIAHIRNASSGPSGIPDPDPFHRYSIIRDFQMLFAHNGTISTAVLMELIMAMNPGYLDLNPPDYAPNYLDSDLYAIYIMEAIDTYYANTIEECIEIAVTKIDSAISPDPVRANFIMSDGSTLWALHFERTPQLGVGVYYYPHEASSSFWVAASVPLDTFSFYWTAVRNSTLVVLKPGESPRLINVLAGNGTELIPQGLLISPNPFNSTTSISFHIPETNDIDLRIYDATGKLVRNLPINRLTNQLIHQISWDGKDDNGNDLPNGTYFCHLHLEETTHTEKIVLTR